MLEADVMFKIIFLLSQAQRKTEQCFYAFCYWKNAGSVQSARFAFQNNNFKKSSCNAGHPPNTLFNFVIETWFLQQWSNPLIFFGGQLLPTKKGG